MNCHIEANNGSVTGICDCGGIAVFEGSICGGSTIELACGSCGMEYVGAIPLIKFDKFDDKPEK